MGRGADLRQRWPVHPGLASHLCGGATCLVGTSFCASSVLARRIDDSTAAEAMDACGSSDRRAGTLAEGLRALLTSEPDAVLYDVTESVGIERWARRAAPGKAARSVLGDPQRFPQLGLCDEAAAEGHGDFGVDFELGLTGRKLERTWAPFSTEGTGGTTLHRDVVDVTALRDIVLGFFTGDVDIPVDDLAFVDLHRTPASPAPTPAARRPGAGCSTISSDAPGAVTEDSAAPLLPHDRRSGEGGGAPTTSTSRSSITDRRPRQDPKPCGPRSTLRG